MCFAHVDERASPKSFVVLILRNSKSNHVGAQRTFKRCIVIRRTITPRHIRPPTRVWEVVRTVAAPPSIVVKCGGGGGGGGSSCGRSWCCSCRVVCCSCCVFVCLCVCDRFIILQIASKFGMHVYGDRCLICVTLPHVYLPRVNVNTDMSRPPPHVYLPRVHIHTG